MVNGGQESLSKILWNTMWLKFSKSTSEDGENDLL